MSRAQRRHGRACPGSSTASGCAPAGAKSAHQAQRCASPRPLSSRACAHRSTRLHGADSVEDFYRGKTITLAIGYSVGGGYDLYGRLLARYLGRYIPGQPAIVPQNREGAGSLRAALYIYGAAPKDGTVIGTFSRSMSVAPLLTGAPFDASKFTWLGSISTDVNVCMTWGASPIKTWDDMLTKPFTTGGEGAGSDPDVFAQMFKTVFGAACWSAAIQARTCNDIVDWRWNAAWRSTAYAASRGAP